MNDRRAIVPQQPVSLAVAPLQFSAEQKAMIRNAYANGASESEFGVLMEVAVTRRLNPLLRQVHFVKRYDSKAKREVWAVQVSIDGLRAIAERTRLYDGQDEPEFEYNAEKQIVLARVKVYKKGVPRPFVGVARWDEYVQTTKDGGETKFWRDMPYTMLGKCAEALAIRKAFPEDSGGLYVPEEMMQAENPQLPRISPHEGPGESLDDPDPEDATAYNGFMATFEAIETEIEHCADYDTALKIRLVLGSRSKQSQLTKRIQEAGERKEISPHQRAELGRLWQKWNRQCDKLEAKFKPSIEDSFRDEPELADIPLPDGRTVHQAFEPELADAIEVIAADRKRTL